MRISLRTEPSARTDEGMCRRPFASVIIPALEVVGWLSVVGDGEVLGLGDVVEADIAPVGGVSDN
jgi:hypothetical protein